MKTNHHVEYKIHVDIKFKINCNLYIHPFKVSSVIDKPYLFATRPWQRKNEKKAEKGKKMHLPTKYYVSVTPTTPQKKQTPMDSKDILHGNNVAMPKQYLIG